MLSFFCVEVTMAVCWYWPSSGRAYWNWSNLGLINYAILSWFVLNHQWWCAEIGPYGFCLSDLIKLWVSDWIICGMLNYCVKLSMVVCWNWLSTEVLFGLGSLLCVYLLVNWTCLLNLIIGVCWIWPSSMLNLVQLWVTYFDEWWYFELVCSVCSVLKLLSGVDGSTFVW